MHPLRLAVVQGCGFVAQAFSAEKAQLTDLIVKAIQHRGFSLLNVISPCVTFNKVNTYDWYRERLYNLDADADFQPTDRAAALAKLFDHDDLVRGMIYSEDGPSFQDFLPGYSGAALHELTEPLSPEYLDEVVAPYKK